MRGRGTGMVYCGSCGNSLDAARYDLSLAGGAEQIEIGCQPVLASRGPVRAPPAVDDYGQPPPGWWLASDGRFYPPISGYPSATYISSGIGWHARKCLINGLFIRGFIFLGLLTSFLWFIPILGWAIAGGALALYRCAWCATAVRAARGREDFAGDDLFTRSFQLPAFDDRMLAAAEIIIEHLTSCAVTLQGDKGVGNGILR